MNDIVSDDKELHIEFKDVKLKKHSALIQISGNRLGIVQKKAFFGLLYYARAQKIVDKNRSVFEIPYSQLKSLCNITAPNNRELHRQLEGLIGTVVRANFLNKDKKKRWEAFSLLSSAREGERGILHFSLPPQIEETLVSPEMYSLIDMKIVREISNRYALDLYELCFDYRKYGVPEISLADFRNLVGVPDDVYPTFKELNKFVIKKSVDEINLKSDISVSPVFIKEGRSVARIKFNVSTKHIIDEPKADIILSQDVLDAIESISAGKGAPYQAAIIHKMLLGDTATTIAVNNFIKQKKNGLKKDLCSKIVIMINSSLIGQSISISNKGKTSVFTLSGISILDDSYSLSGVFSGGKPDSVLLSADQLIESFSSLLD